MIYHGYKYLSGTLGIIIYFLRRKYPACKAAKGLSREWKREGVMDVQNGESEEEWVKE